MAACRRVEAGMPGGYLLAAVARQYAHVQEITDLAAMLAGRVGNPRVPPKPPAWPLLALVLLEWRESIAAEGVIESSIKLGEEDEVHRGLVIAAHLFPEFNPWLSGVTLKIPLWERTLSVPLAARRLVLLQVAD
jgi:hypothetical protein